MMGAIVGVVIGYLLGTRAGDRGREDLREAWKTITTSSEVRDIVRGGIGIAGNVLRQGGLLLAERLQPAESDRMRAA